MFLFRKWLSIIKEIFISICLFFKHIFDYGNLFVDPVLPPRQLLNLAWSWNIPGQTTC